MSSTSASGAGRIINTSPAKHILIQMKNIMFAHSKDSWYHYTAVLLLLIHENFYNIVTLWERKTTLAQQHPALELFDHMLSEELLEHFELKLPSEFSAVYPWTIVGSNTADSFIEFANQRELAIENDVKNVSGSREEVCCLIMSELQSPDAMNFFMKQSPEDQNKLLNLFRKIDVGRFRADAGTLDVDLTVSTLADGLAGSMQLK
jgi:hypothetical protein